MGALKPEEQPPFFGRAATDPNQQPHKPQRNGSVGRKASGANQANQPKPPPKTPPAAPRLPPAVPKSPPVPGTTSTQGGGAEGSYFVTFSDGRQVPFSRDPATIPCRLGPNCGFHKKRAMSI